MQFYTTLLVAAAVLSTAVEGASITLQPGINKWPALRDMSGFNLGANRASDNACKTTADWKKEFNTIKNTWGAKNAANKKAKFGAVKIFSTSDCNALALAAPAAKAAGIKIWAGIWGSDDVKFAKEKKALEDTIRANGASWLMGINVGSEALYRKEIQPGKLAQQIYDVKGMVQKSLGASKVPVGSADTWTSWVKAENKVVIAACDIILMNGFPYWQGTPINQGLTKFQEAISNTRRAIGSNKPFMIGETGWPTAGKNFDAAVPTLANLRTYWKAVTCWLMQRDYPFFWFSGFDEPHRETGEYGVVERNFGIAWSGGSPKVEMQISKLC